ncbi:uncharacterized protein LOC112578702 isoform X2 [Bubalus bubalis]|uniref:uncharacterized protein LOC112578702 isoform X2 n=1 Tax=Bubalus bubalis TaxID=89462 RepID=UPI001D0F7FC9|nr:uncharacterized protein LOC112578702 isoform X2 [Bubalus bubalis]
MMTQGFIQGCLNPSCCCLLQACKRAELPDIILRHFHPRSEVPVNHSSAGMLGFRCLKSGCQQGCAPSAGSRSGSSLASSQLLVVTSIPWLAYVLGDLIMVYFELAKLIPTTGPLHRIFSSSGMFFPQHPQEASTTMISISQMRKQKLKEMKLLRVTQLVTAGKGTQTMVVSCYDGASCGFKSYALCRDENDTQLAPRKLTAMHQAVTHKILNPHSSSLLENADPLENVIKTLDHLRTTQMYLHANTGTEFLGLTLKRPLSLPPVLLRPCLLHPFRAEGQ